MNPSPEFLEMASGFGQDCLVLDEKVENAVDAALTLVEHRNVKKLKSFLDDALSGAVANEELHQMWANSPASIYFTSSEATVNFLKLVRARLASHPNFQKVQDAIGESD